MTTIAVGRHDVQISKPDKVLFPEAGITKAELADYYARIAPVMLPHVKGRPLNLQRFPEGVGRNGFLSQSIPDYFPDWVDRVTVEKQGGTVTHVVAERPETLVYLAVQSAITPHAWLSRRDRLERPDRLVFDLDPSTRDFGEVRTAALALRELLEQLALTTFVMTTGSRGLHVVVSLKRNQDFSEVRAFARSVAAVAAARDPDRLTVEQRKAKRGDRIFIDVGRNAYGQTSAPPYAVRGKEGAPVATPLDWSEVTDEALGPQSFNIRNLDRRMAHGGDRWADIAESAKALAEAKRRLEQLAES